MKKHLYFFTTLISIFLCTLFSNVQNTSAASPNQYQCSWVVISGQGHCVFDSTDPVNNGCTPGATHADINVCNAITTQAACGQPQTCVVDTTAPDCGTIGKRCCITPNEGSETCRFGSNCSNPTNPSAGTCQANVQCGTNLQECCTGSTCNEIALYCDTADTSVGGLGRCKTLGLENNRCLLGGLCANNGLTCVNTSTGNLCKALPPGCNGLNGNLTCGNNSSFCNNNNLICCPDANHDALCAAVPAGSTTLSSPWCDNDQGVITALGCLNFTGTKTVSTLLSWGVVVGGGIAFVMILIAALQINTARGDAKRVQAGKELLFSALAGVMLIVLSVVLLNFIGVNLLGLDSFGFNN